MPLTTEQIQQLDEALDRGEPTPWLFSEDGLRVVGIIRRLEEIETEYGQALTLVLEVDNHERRILLTEVLKRKLKRLDVRAGEPIGIERDPEKTRPKNGGTPYWDYQVRRLEDQQPQELDWSSKAALTETVDAELIEYSDDDAPPNYQD
jgi:hypothetical protein